MLRFGVNQLEMFRASGCPHCELSRRLRDRLYARQWVAQLAGDPGAMTTMRRLLSEETGSTEAGRMTDDEVMDALSDLISRGFIHVHGHSAHFDFGTLKSQAAGASAPKEKPYPLAERQQRGPSSRSTVADPNTFGPNLHAATQASTLTAAAAQGKPFCPE